MIIFGDIAWPKNEAPLLNNFPQFILDEKILANLEGQIVDDNHRLLNTTSLFTYKKGFELINSIFNIKWLSLSNNHIYDISSDISNTLEFLKKREIEIIGLQQNSNYSFCNINDEFGKMVLFNFGFSDVSCKIPNTASQRINIFDEKTVVQSIKYFKKLNPDTKVVLFLHWGIEFDKYPSPTNRLIAHNLIDVGVDLIIGCHSHSFSGIEKYNNKYIVYGIGNFLLPSEKFMNGNLIYPHSSSLQLGVLFNSKLDSIRIISIVFNSKYNSLTYIGEYNINEHPILEYYNFSNISNYDLFYKKHSRKLKLYLRIYNNDSKVIKVLKISYNTFRQFMLTQLVNINTKIYVRYFRIFKN